ncbi:MAG: T9SS type A sorting domain-containing protein [Prolixibacteraceae bacterium]|nr:T9SS type A sorting domain-containing protein [Prolixibacteraceae bacterium]
MFIIGPLFSNCFVSNKAIVDYKSDTIVIDLIDSIESNCGCTICISISLKPKAEINYVSLNGILYKIEDYHSASIMRYENRIAKVYLSQNDLIVEGYSVNKSIFVLSILDVSGCEVLSTKIKMPDITSYDLTGNPNGLYFVNLQNNKENYTQKIVLQQ